MVSGQPRTREMEVMLRFNVAKVAKLYDFESYCHYKTQKTIVFCNFYTENAIM